MIRNLPVTDVIPDLIKQLALYGAIEEYDIVTDLPSAPFTQTVRVKFQLVSAARQAKNKMNKTSFFGQDLWIQYAPEYEDVQDVEWKLRGRKIAVMKRLEELVVERREIDIHDSKKKGKIPLRLLSTAGLLGEEEAMPANDYLEVQHPLRREFVAASPSQQESISANPSSQAFATVNPPKQELSTVNPPKQELTATNPLIEGTNRE